MRKSIKRIVSTVLAATMVLTSSVVGNVVSASAATSTFKYVPTADVAKDAVVYTDANVDIVAESALSYNTTSDSMNFDDRAYIGYLKTPGSSVNSALTVDGNTLICRLAFKITAKKDATIRVDHKINTGKSNCILKNVVFDGGTNENGAPTGKADNVLTEKNDGSASVYKTSTVELKANDVVWVAGISSDICVFGIDAQGVGSDEPTTTTEATTFEATTEATTSAVVDTTTETTTNVTAEANQVVITPVYTKTADGGVDVDYYANLGDGAKFNNYTLFLNFDATKLVPKTVTDGNITLVAGQDAQGKDIVLTASNATNISKQFENVPVKGNQDFANADGVKTQAQLGRVKVAYCVFDNDFSAATGNLPAFTTSGKLFSIHFDKAEGVEAVDGATLAVEVGTLNSVSADASINSTPSNKTVDVVIGGGEVTTELTTEATTATTTEATTVDTAFAIAGDTVNANTGDVKTVTFKLNNNPGVASVVAVVKFNPADLELQSGTVKGFSAPSQPDVNNINAQMAYVPTKGDTDYPGADGIKTAAQLGVVKFALANAGADVTGNDTAFTLDFKVLATKTGTYPVELNVLSAANTNATTLNCVGKNGAIVIAGSDVTTEATTQVTTEATTVTETTTKSSDVTTEATTATETTTKRPSSGGGGGGGGSSHRATTTTTTTVETTTEVTTDNVDTPSNDDKPVVIDPDKGISINPPTNKDENFKGFKDIENYPWAKDSINKLAELGIISGIADGSYGPALPCKRGDFAILINKTLGIKVSSTAKNFADNADSSKYYYNDLIVGYNAGILSGYGDNNYKPEQYCTREEMAVLIAKSFEWLGNDVTSVDQSVNNKYSDVANISWWSAPYVAYLTDKGIMNGNTDGTLLPKNYINRAEMAVMMSKVYDYALEFVNDKRA